VCVRLGAEKQDLRCVPLVGGRSELVLENRERAVSLGQRVLTLDHHARLS
jgi:hypothetical protein